MANSPAAKANASATQTPVQIAASLGRTTWGVRWKTPRSSDNIASTKLTNPTQNQMFVSIITPEKYPESRVDASSRANALRRALHSVLAVRFVSCFLNERCHGGIDAQLRAVRESERCGQ